MTRATAGKRAVRRRYAILGVLADATPQQPAQPCPNTTVSDETKGESQ